jgi:hypothetical protein
VLNGESRACRRRHPKIAFPRDNAIRTANIDGSGARQILDGTDPAISPDGTRMAFTLNGSGTGP